MIAPTYPNRTRVVLAAFLVSTAWAQTAPAPAATQPATVLTPFEVRSEKDTGYLASQTLSGTRLNTKVEDTGVAETIITPDFMRDLGLTSLDEVFKFVPNTTTDDPNLGTTAGSALANTTFPGLD